MSVLKFRGRNIQTRCVLLPFLRNGWEQIPKFKVRALSRHKQEVFVARVALNLCNSPMVEWADYIHIYIYCLLKVTSGFHSPPQVLRAWDSIVHLSSWRDSAGSLSVRKHGQSVASCFQSFGCFKTCHGGHSKDPLWRSLPVWRFLVSFCLTSFHWHVVSHRHYKPPSCC